MTRRPRRSKAAKPPKQPPASVESRSTSPSPWREHRFPWTLLGAAAVVAIGWIAYSNDRPRELPAPAASANRADGGVRSEELITRVRLLPTPEELIPPRDCAATRPWVIPDRDRASTLSLLTLTLRDPALVAAMEPHLSCGTGPGCTIRPPIELIESLPAPARSRLYGVLNNIDTNPQAEDAFRRPVAAGPFSSIVGLPPEARPLMDRLTWQQGGVPTFSDFSVVCSRLPTDASRRAFVRAMLTRRTTDVSLRIDSPGAIDRIVAGFPDGAQRAVRAQLAAARAGGESTIALAALMPEWARLHVGTFPAASEAWTNCFWTALRFIDPAPSPPVSDGEVWGAMVEREFVRVREDYRFGDILVLRDGSGRRTHAATWLLAGYLYTKDGMGSLLPWRVASLDDLLNGFPTTATMEFWRRRPAS